MSPLSYNLPDTWALLPVAIRSMGKEIIREYTNAALLVFADLLAEHVANGLVEQYWRVVGEVMFALEVMVKDPLMQGSAKRFSKMEQCQREGMCHFRAEGTKIELHWLVGPRGGLTLLLKRQDGQIATTFFHASRLGMNSPRARFALAREMAKFIRKYNMKPEA